MPLTIVTVPAKVDVRGLREDTASDAIASNLVALQSATDRAAAKGQAAWVDIPDIDLWAAGALTWRSGVELRGRGSTRTKLNLALDSNTPLIWDGGTADTTLREAMVVSGMTLDGHALESTVSADGAAALLRCYRANRLELGDIVARYGRSYGIGIEGRPSSGPPKDGPQDFITLDNVVCEFNSRGRMLTSTTLTEALDATSTLITVTSTTGFTSETLMLGDPAGEHELVGFWTGSPSYGPTTIGSCVRGIAQTTARSWPVGTPVQAMVNADGFDCKFARYLVIRNSRFDANCDKGCNPRALGLEIDGLIARWNGTNGLGVSSAIPTISVPDTRTVATIKGLLCEENSGSGATFATVGDGADAMFDIYGAHSNRNRGNGITFSGPRCYGTLHGGHTTGNANGVAVTGTARTIIDGHDASGNREAGIAWTNQVGGGTAADCITDDNGEAGQSMLVEDGGTISGIRVLGGESLRNRAWQDGSGGGVLAGTPGATPATPRPWLISTAATDIRISGVTDDYPTTRTSNTDVSVPPAFGNQSVLDMTGSTTIETITPQLPARSVLTFRFTGAPLVKHGIAGAGGIDLLTGTDMQTAAGDMLTLFWDGTRSTEITRSRTTQLADALSGLWVTLPDSARGGNVANTNQQRVLLPGDGLATFGGGNAGPGIIWIEPSYLALTGRATKLALWVWMSTNNVDPGCDITISLYTVAGTDGAAQLSVTPGPLITSVTFTDTELTTKYGGTKLVEFDPPAAGRYMIVSSASATPTTNCVAQARACVLARHT